MIFLGAGASVIFGIKTMQNLTDDLVKTMRDMGQGETIDKIVQSLTRFKLTPDFESIYTTLEALTAPEDAVRKSGSFAAFIANTCKGFEEIKAHKEFEQALASFRQLIYDSCTIKPPELVEQNQKTLNRLFEVCAHFGETRHLSSLIGFWSGGGPSSDSGVDVGKTIVTTNYDMAIELYHRSLEMPLGDGFKPTPNPFVTEFDPTHYFGHQTDRWLIKLHGSIWQFRQGNRIIKTIEDPVKSSLNIEIDEQMMIYPVGEKPILRDPYYYFYEVFKEQRWKKMIVIGYSFRDEPVNVAFMENLQKVKDATLIVVDPMAASVIKNMGSWAQEFVDRIIPIPGRFGDESVFDDLSLALKVGSRTRYNERKREEIYQKRFPGAGARI